MVLLGTADEVWRIAALLHLTNGLQQELTLPGDRLVGIAQMLGRAILNWAGGLRRPVVVVLEYRPQPGDAAALHLLAILQIAVRPVTDVMVVGRHRQQHVLFQLRAVEWGRAAHDLVFP